MDFSRREFIKLGAVGLASLLPELSPLESPPYSRQPHFGTPPNPDAFIHYEWNHLLGDMDPTWFWKADNSLPQWWEDWWFENCWLDAPKVWIPKTHKIAGEVKKDYQIFIDSPEEFVRRWFIMQEKLTGGLIKYDPQMELRRALISNPNLFRLAVNWRRKHVV